MPTRRPTESRDDFLERCMGDEKMAEYETPQRYAICNKYADNPAKAEETLEALQYGRPGKNDPRKTPAEPSERRKGSKRNKPGSAKKPNKNISFSKSTESRLRELMRKHNAKGKGSKASMGMLKTVYRRGAGAFSRSHAPNMSRGGWGIARVKAFLYLLRNGRPSNPNYKQDNDLLPKSHPRAKKASEEDYIFKNEESGYETMDYQAAEYQGKKVKLNKPFRTSGGPKKFAVYVQNEAGRVVIVRFGDPNMEIKRDDPDRRRNFRSRHNCDSPGPKTKARYWSCKMWESSKSVTDYTSSEDWEADEDLDLTFEELWEQNEEQPIFEDIEEVGAEEECSDCGNDCCNDEAVEAAEPKPKSTETHEEYMDRCTAMGYTKDECMKAHEGHKFKDQDEAHTDKDHMKADEGCGCGMSVEAAKVGKDMYDNPGEAQNRAKELGLEGIHTVKKGDDTFFMPGKNKEAYMKKVGNKEEEEVKVRGYHKKKKKDGYASYGDSCPPGKKMKDGKCVRVAITLDAIIDNAEAIVEAKTGKTVIKISGVAFHEGMNKNYWEITREGADGVVSQMPGSDITLNHPKAEQGRFKRNMAGIDEGVIGRVSSASLYDKENDMWEVRFMGTVERSELFEVLESGLWLREGYGVSIGGTGVPDKVVEASDGRSKMIFATDFTFDHLAIVHKPAYPRAVIDEAVKVNQAVAEEMFIGNPTQSQSNGTGLDMTDEQIETAIASEDLAAKMAQLEKELVLANSRVAEFEAGEKAREEELRMEIVKEASEAGLKGHEALPTDTIKELLAAWNESKPVREMKPVEPASAPAVASDSSAVVANYLNGKIVRSPEEAYKASFNSLVAAYNRGSPQRDHAPTYEEAKQKGLI